MKLFISWAKPQSRAIAEAWYDWIPNMLQSVEPFMSARDIGKGARPMDVIAHELEASDFGLCCVTREALHADWLMFEAGALSKHHEKARVFTYLYDLEHAEVTGPLSQFQHTKADRDDTFRLVDAMNVGLAKPLKAETLETTFDALWPKLETSMSAKLAAIPVPEEAPPAPRSKRDILEEILGIARELRDPNPLNRIFVGSHWGTVGSIENGAVRIGADGSRFIYQDGVWREARSKLKTVADIVLGSNPSPGNQAMRPEETVADEPEQETD